MTDLQACLVVTSLARTAQYLICSDLEQLNACKIRWPATTYASNLGTAVQHTKC